MKMLSVGLIILSAATFAAIAADPFVGTWKVIPGSVKSQSGRTPKSVVLKYEAIDAAGEMKFTLNAEMDERPYSYSWTARPDGKKYPVTGQTGAQEVEFRRPAENHAITIHYRDGQEIARHDSTISGDGKALTTKSRSRSREGVVFETEAQYQKQ